ncbi:MAG: hypothetical protein AAF138_08585 [Planctomycetota bacterium]
MNARIIHVGLGPLGRTLLGDFVSRGLGEIVAAVDTNPELAGRDLSEYVAGAPSGVRVQGTLDELPEADAAIVTTRSALPDCAETFRTLLARGLPVISTCEELLWPSLRHAALADDLDAHAKAHGGRLMGTGVNPGFLMDTLAAVVSTACHRVDRVRIERVQNAASRRTPFQKKIGASMSPEAFRAGVDQGWLRHVGLGESMALACHALGLAFDDWDEQIEPVLAAEPMQCALGAIPAGHASGVRQVARARSGGETVATLEFVAAIGQADPRDAIHIEGKPDLSVVIPGGVHGDVATSAVTLNALASLLDSAPGLHTMLSIRTPHLAVAPRG